MEAAKKVKKRIAPTLVAPLASKPREMDSEDELSPKQLREKMQDDLGPKGPRKNPRALLKGGANARKISDIIKGGAKLHANPWVHHVKKYAQVNGIPYGCALSMPEIKTGYRKGVYTNTVDIPKKRPVSPPKAAKPKRAKKGDESKEAEKHLKFLSKLGMGDEASLKKKRLATFENIFQKYNKPFIGDKNVF